MKWFILFMVINNKITTQEFFGETACNRAIFMLQESKQFTGDTFCTPKSLGKQFK